ncbi:hypothetical protein [Allorhodopirellula heiligendammensis]|uniref:Uncharacterized protein n=1 Tax=Allorhodopirellula heiligendammensis TaxID=2714739 RepID=A0A5C6BK29_9BACT|nr:hypothetical protein [Allorhodopirellula heiligendammensis]TWU10814.1 hypothetical protein Poly21_47200 [Allorhodopirellula heiligendammensis]
MNLTLTKILTELAGLGVQVVSPEKGRIRLTCSADCLKVSGVNFLQYNSANFDGLRPLENLIKDIGPPKHPWPIDQHRMAQ